MPEPQPNTTYDTTILPSTGAGPITSAIREAHHEALHSTIAMEDLVAVLSSLVPAKAAALGARLDKYRAGRLTPAAMLACCKMDVGVPRLFLAYEQLAPGFDSKLVFPAGFEHPILV